MVECHSPGSGRIDRRFQGQEATGHIVMVTRDVHLHGILLPMLAILLTALCAAPAAHAQSRTANPAPDKQTVIPVWNKGSGKVEAILLLEPTGEAGPGARWRFGNNSLDAAFGLGAGDSLGLLCSGPGGGGISSLASHCLLASLGADGRDGASRRLSATTAVGRQGNRFGLTAGTTFKGPAVIEERESTAVVGPDTTISVDQYLNLIVDIQDARGELVDG